ncbi:hypothetical protein GCM10023340_30170 [Nocardioides marinquilinus]|uniref:DUF222 domain-containing protein n=1 Tax=Nocardioides marinquilinus TaxID=1210400 RepID=A0ABP9PSF5_9ACTN
MSDETPGSGTDGEHPDVGSVGEEAAKLFGALSTWARDAGGADLGAVAGAMAGSVSELGDHVATGAEECRWCPVCRAVHAVRELNPEVRTHLTSAASSLLQAASELLASLPQPTRERPAGAGEESGFEKIDLDGDDPDEHPHEHPHDRGAT